MHDLDEVRTLTNSLFEAMNGHYLMRIREGGTAVILRVTRCRSSEALREDSVHAVA